MLADKDTDAGIASDWAKIQDKYKADEVETPTPDAPGDDAPEPEKIPVSREADGKFKTAEKDKPVKDAKPDKGKPAKEPKPALDGKTQQAAADASAPAAAEQPNDGTTQQRDITRAPSTWKPAARAEFDKLPPTIKAEIHRREADFSNGQAQLIPDATLGRELRGVIDPFRGMIEAEGGTPARAVADLFRTAAIFRTGSQQQKLQAVAQVCDQFHVDLTPLFNVIQQQRGGQPLPQGQPQQFRDPRVDQILATQNLEKQQAQQREQAQTESTVTRWMNEQDAQGNPKREYLGDVINEMSALVPQIRASDPSMTHAQALDAAYDRAIWAHPEIRTLLNQKQQTELDATRRADNQTRVRDARRAGSVNVPRRASTPSPGKPGTMDQTIAATARELGLIT
jgi:hypothetical protein